MAIDPELKELVGDLRALTANAERAGIALRSAGFSRDGMGRLRGPNGEFATDQQALGVIRNPAGAYTGKAGGRIPRIRFKYARDFRNDVVDIANTFDALARGDEMGAVRAAIGLLPPNIQLPVRLAERGFSYFVEREERRKENFDDIRKLQDQMASINRGVSHTTEQFVQAAVASIQNDKNRTWTGAIRSNIQKAGNSGLLGIGGMLLAGYLANRDEEEALASAREKTRAEIEAVVKIEDDFYRKIDLGDVAHAAKLQAKMFAASQLTGYGRDRLREIGGPAEVWFRRDMARNQHRDWSALQSPRAGPRPEID